MTILLDDQRTVDVAAALSPTHRQILVYLAHGLTGAQVARRFGMPTYGVWNRTVTLYAALGVGTATTAVARGHDIGIIPLEPYGRIVLDADRRLLLRWAASGETDQQIASRLGVHVSRVRHRLGDMYRAMGVKNRPQAVHAGYCAGILGGAS